MVTCSLWKVELVSEDEPKEVVFWAYHMTELRAREAAHRWGRAKYPDAGMKIVRIELIK